MKNKNALRVLAFMLSALMLIGMIPVTAYAALSVPSEMTLISDVETTLAPGITQNQSVIYDKNGNRVELFIATADLNVDTVGVQSSYVGAQCVNHGMAKMTEQVAAAEAKYEARGEQYTAVVGMNGSYYNMTTGQPSGAFYMEGVNGNGSNPNGNPFFAILKDGTPIIAKAGQYETYKDQIYEAVGGNEILVWDGVNTYPSTDTAKYPRSAIGITADGKVIFINANGNQAPKSVGLTRYELGQLFVELGCVSAIKMDEGGSATYVTKPQGSDEMVVTNTPSDGAERPVSTGIIIYSTAKGDGEFDSAVLTPEHNYVTPESIVNVNAIGADAVGGAAEIPADVIWQLKDNSLGTVVDGVFTSNGQVGAAVIQMLYKGKVVGETTVNVVVPDIKFTNSTIVVPYGKNMLLNVVATVNNGANTVTLKDGDIVYTLSSAALGTVEGNSFTACEASSGLTGGSVTATFKYDAGKTDTAAIEFGRGSEIVQDFETAVSDDFIMRSYYYDRNGQSGGNGPLGRMERGEAYVVDATTGKVRNGNKALAVRADFGVSTAAGAKSVMLHMPPMDVTGATSIGMWIYIGVKEMSNLELSFRTNSTITTPGYTKIKSAVLFKWKNFTGGSVQPTEDGWYYFQVDVSGMDQIASLNIQITDPDYQVWNPYQDYVFYIDDITADFSDAVEDRENPSFSGIYVSETADSKVAMAGQTITMNTITVVANAADADKFNATGLNAASAKVYVDGVLLTKGVTCAADGTVMADGVTLSNGIHTFRFEIADNAGNVGVISRDIVINDTIGEVSLVPANPNAALVPLGSVLYYNLVAKNIENIDSVTVAVELDNVSSWDLAGMEAAYGFEITGYADDLNIAHITVTRTEGSTATGEAVLATLPVRVWAPIGHTDKLYLDAGVVSANPGLVDSYKMMTPYGMWYSDGTRMYRVEVKVLEGKVTFVDQTTDSFTSKEYHTLTEMNRYRADGYYDANWNYIKENPATNEKEVRQDKWSSHIHVAGSAQSKAPTCTTPGYTDRIFCVDCDCGAKENIYQATKDVACKGHTGGCGSVIDWGTVIPATGHTYEVIDGVLKCACGEVFSGVYTDGKTYFDGIVAEDWIDGKYYVDGVYLTGVQLMDGFYQNFGTDGICTGKYTGKFYNETLGGYCYALLGELQSGWYMADDVWSYYGHDDYLAKIGSFTFETGRVAGITYVFDDEGNLTTGVWNVTEAGTRYYYGPDYYYWANNMIVEIDGKEYCFDRDGWLYKGAQVLRVGYNQPNYLYHFDKETGELVHIYKEESGLIEIDGKLFYLQNGAHQVGLHGVNGNYYFFDYEQATLGQAISGKANLTAPMIYGSRCVTGVYTFGDDFKMAAPEVRSEEGGLALYLGGVKQVGIGLINVNGDRYYVNSKGILATGKYKLLSGYTGCSELATGYYDFGTDGKLKGPYVEEEEETTTPSTPPTPTDTYEFKVEDGTLGYFVNGVRQKGLGMITVNGDRYYINGKGIVATGMYKILSVYTGCSDLADGYYDFGEDGKLKL